MQLSRYKRHQKILVAVDCIIFGFDGRQLKALLIKRGFEPEKGKWSLMGGFIGVFWGLLMWLITWSRQGVPTWIAVTASVLAGALFGVCMAIYFRRLARKHGLSAWAGSQP